MTLAALEATLRLYLHPEKLAAELPTLRLLSRSVQDIQQQAERLREPLAARYGDEFSVQVMPCASQIGSGSLPSESLPSAAIALTPHDGRGSQLEALSTAGAACLSRLSGEFMMVVCGWICAALKMNLVFWRCC